MTNATISASDASEEWKRAISRLYGAGSSPMMMPATRTARNPDPWATVAAPKMTSTPASTRGE